MPSGKRHRRRWLLVGHDVPAFVVRRRGVLRIQCDARRGDDTVRPGAGPRGRFVLASLRRRLSARRPGRAAVEQPAGHATRNASAGQLAGRRSAVRRQNACDHGPAEVSGPRMTAWDHDDALVVRVDSRSAGSRFEVTPRLGRGRAIALRFTRRSAPNWLRGRQAGDAKECQTPKRGLGCR